MQDTLAWSESGRAGRGLLRIVSAAGVAYSSRLTRQYLRDRGLVMVIEEFFTTSEDPSKRRGSTGNPPHRDDVEDYMGLNAVGRRVEHATKRQAPTSRCGKLALK